MNDELYTAIAIILIFFGWIFYINLGGKKQKFYKKGETFDDNFGDYFAEDIKKLIQHVDQLPKINQINIYENVLGEIAKYTKETTNLNSPRKVNKVYKKYVLDAGKQRRKNMDINLGYKNPKWLAATIFESYLRSDSEKMTFNNGAKIRRILFLKIKELIPQNNNLKIFLKINNIK